MSASTESFQLSLVTSMAPPSPALLFEIADLVSSIREIIVEFFEEFLDGDYEIRAGWSINGWVNMFLRCDCVLRSIHQVGGGSVPGTGPGVTGVYDPDEYNRSQNVQRIMSGTGRRISRSCPSVDW